MREGKGAEEARKHKKKKFSTKTQASRRKRKKQKSKKCVCLVFCALLEETNENNFCLYVSVSSPQFGSGSGGEMGESCIYCIFYQVCFDFKRQMLVNKHYFVAMLVNSQYLSLRFGFESPIWDRIWGGGLGLLCFVYFL